MGRLISPEALRRFPLFAGVEGDLLRKLAMTAQRLHSPPDEILFHEGDRADRFYIILRGAIELRIAMGGKSMTQFGLSTLGINDVLGWSALIEPYEYQMSAYCQEECELIAFDGLKLSELIGHQPQLGYMLMNRLLQIVSSRLTDMHIRMASLIEGESYQDVAGRVPMYVSDGGRTKPIDQ
jgi:CRP/FNR family cyclic AMP-dependent transcriptional regulator